MKYFRKELFDEIILNKNDKMLMIKSKYKPEFHPPLDGHALLDHPLLGHAEP